MQRRLLDEADGAGAPDRVVSASADEALCAAFDIAVRTAQELSTAKDADLQELLTSAQAPMKDIATRLEAAGLWRTARFWNSYHQALVETAAVYDPSDPASRDAANLRFRAVKALGAGTTAVEAEAACHGARRGLRHSIVSSVMCSPRSSGRDGTASMLTTVVQPVTCWVLEQPSPSIPRGANTT